MRQAAPSIAAECTECGERIRVEARGASSVACPHCGTSWSIANETEGFERCPICECARFYTQKDFPAPIGCGIVLVGAALVPLTYGLSLPAFFLIDLLLYRRVPVMAVCYLCRAEYRGWPIPKTMKPFRHHMAEGYERRRERLIATREARRQERGR